MRQARIVVQTLTHALTRTTKYGCYRIPKHLISILAVTLKEQKRAVTMLKVRAVGLQKLAVMRATAIGGFVPLTSAIAIGRGASATTASTTSTASILRIAVLFPL